MNGGFDCYIFYTQHSAGDFYAQAMYQKQIMEAEGKTVKLILANSSEDFINGWNTIPNGTENIMIFSHSDERCIILSEDGKDGMSIDGKRRNGDPIGDITALSPKDIESVTIYGCNAGHLDAAISQNDNAAQAFAGINGIGEVVAYDGNVGFGPTGAAIDGSDSLYARASNRQGSFWNLANQGYGYENGIYARNPEGRIVYYPDGTWEILGW